MAEDKEKQPKDAKKDEPAKDEQGKDEQSKKGKGKDKKDDKEPKGGRKEMKLHKKDLSLKPDFRYVVRIASIDIDGTRTVSYGLTQIPGIGIRVAQATVSHLNVPASELMGNLSDEQIASLEASVQGISKTLPPWILNRRNDWEMGDTRHLFGPELELKRRDDINLMKMIRCYKGIRHEDGQKVRGQRTKSNGRSGLTVGVTRKSILAAQKAGKDAEAGGKKEEKAAAPAAKAAPAAAAKPAAEKK